MSNGLLPSGTYQFDATGKMIDPPAGEFPHQHVWGEGVVTTPANCTDGGVRTYICECGLSKTEAIEKLGHTDEVEDYKCDRCGTPIAHDHVWNEGIVTTPANCTEEGVKTYTCKCGEIKTEKLEALGHIDEDEDFACDRCGTAVEHIHAWNDGEITTPATCTKEGVKTYTCKCGETKTEPVATIAHADENDDFKCDTCGTVVEHDHVWNEGVITTPATCTKDGVKTYACKCGETKTETVAAPGKHIDENGDLTCDICGETVAVKNGVVFDSDGNVRYYVDGKATRAGLVQDSKGNYYYINSSLKAVKNCTYAFSTAMGNGLMPGGTYKFDASGKMILD
jgi:predicted peroxiredoxin